MQIIISPARKMTVDPDGLPYRDLPKFLPQAQEILDYLKERSLAELQAIWQCSDRLVRTNAANLQAFDLERNLTPALLAFTGPQYLAMGPGVFTDAEWAYVQAHLRILSGFYGVLRPLDGIVNYRLGLSDRAQVAGTTDLYQYWGDRIAQAVFGEGNLILNLASQEYAKAIRPYLTPQQALVTCTFGRLVAGKVKQQSTRAKQARGNMVRFLATNQVDDLAQVKNFTTGGYAFQPAWSTPTNLVFVQEG